MKNRNGNLRQRAAAVLKEQPRREWKPAAGCMKRRSI